MNNTTIASAECFVGVHYVPGSVEISEPYLQICMKQIDPILFTFILLSRQITLNVTETKKVVTYEVCSPLVNDDGSSLFRIAFPVPFVDHAKFTLGRVDSEGIWHLYVIADQSLDIIVDSDGRVVKRTREFGKKPILRIVS